MKQKVLVIVGPTASGKSALAVRLAKKLNGEIISADSRQVYKGLDIGSGKITKKEMRGIPHHLLNVANPRKQFSVADYKKLVLDNIRYIVCYGKLPIIVGGTGFYIDSLTMSLPEVPPDQTLRKKLANKSVEELSEMLGKHKIADRKNKVRLIRAIEIVKALGKIPKIKKSSKYDFVFIGLKPKNLDERIYKRLIARLPGIIKEVRKLHRDGLSWKRMYELGLEYRYVSLYVRGNLKKLDVVNKLYKEICNYSKRQMTWFKNNKKITWFDSASSPSLLSTIQKRLE